MIPSCFSNPNSTPKSSSQMHQNLLTCIYQTNLCNSPTFLTLTWSKTLFSHSLTIHASNFFSISIPLHPSAFPFFGARPGSKSVHLNKNKKIKLYWDFTKAELNQHHHSAEPESGFYIAVISKSRIEFFLGDLWDELIRRSGFEFNPSCCGESLLLSRREHVFGQRNYKTWAQIQGCKHEIGIECGGGVLKVKIDGAIRLIVKRLAWKFRGNERIIVGGVEVDFYWDVFNWVNKCNVGRNGNGHGVFVFQIGDGGVWPEMVGAEKKLLRKSLSSAAGAGGVPVSSFLSPSQSPSCSSVMQWAEESSDCGWSSSCSSSKSSGTAGGFSLLLYAWRKD